MTERPDTRAFTERRSGVPMAEHFYLPTNERQSLVKVLGEMPELVENLARCMTIGIRAQTFEPKVSTGEKPQPLPFAAGADEVAEDLRRELMRWVKWLCEVRRITHPRFDILPMARFLNQYILILATTPGSDTAYTSIAAKAKAAQRCAGRRPSASTVHVVDVAQARNQELNANGCAILAREIGVEGLTRTRINNLKRLGHIEPLRQFGKFPIYRLGDVLDAHETVITWKRRTDGKLIDLTNQSPETEKSIQ